MRSRANTLKITKKRKSSARNGRLVSYALDVPLQAQYDADSGVLVIETPVFEDGPPPEPITLHLSFSAIAAATFARLLSALEDEGFSIEDRSGDITLQ